MKLSIPCAVLLSAFAPLAQAQRADLPPAEQVITALENHPFVTAARARLSSAKAGRDMLNRGAHEFTLGGSYARRDVALQGNYNEFDVTLNHTLRLPQKAALDRKAGALGIEVAQNQMEDAMHQTALLFSALWHDWLTASSIYRSDTDSVQTMEQALTALQRRVELRDASQLDADLATAALAQARAQADLSHAGREQAQVTLAAVFPDIPLSPEPPELATPELPSQELQTMRDQVIARSHEIRAADREAQRLGVVAQRVRADRIADPTVGVRAFNELGGNERGAGVMLSIPLGGRYRQAAADQAAAQADAAHQELLNIQRSITAMADADLSNARLRLQAWNSAATSAQSTNEALRRTERGYELGQIDLADLLTLRRQANEARRLEIQARSDADRALLKLQIDSHTLWLEAESTDPDPTTTDDPPVAVPAANETAAAPQ